MKEFSFHWKHVNITRNIYTVESLLTVTLDLESMRRIVASGEFEKKKLELKLEKDSPGVADDQIR